MGSPPPTARLTHHRARSRGQMGPEGGVSMIEILRELLDVRHKLGRIENMLLEYGWLDALQPDFRAMQDLERSISQRVNDWDRPDPLAATPAPRETETVPEPLRDGTKSEDASLQAAALNNFDTVW